VKRTTLILEDVCIYTPDADFLQFDHIEVVNPLKGRRARPARRPSKMTSSMISPHDHSPPGLYSIR
jgi:hypothetical protein